MKSALDLQIDINMVDDTNFEPFLLNMLREEKVEVIKDVKLNITINEHGTTLLHDAVKRGNLDLMNSLIDGGCDVDVADNYGNTPLILASKVPKDISFREILIICTLIESDASVLLTNKIGKSAAEILIRDSRVEGSIILSKLLKKLKEECGNDSLLTTKKLMEFGCLLPQAVNLKDTSITKYMLDNGYDVNQRLGLTAMHWAVINSDIENVKLLLHYGADVNSENHLDHRKPADLLQFRQDESVEILELLVDQGASLLDDYGDFVNDDFIKYGTKKFINALIRIYKPNFDRKVPSGETLLHLLVSNDYFDPIEELQGQKLTIETVRYVHKKYHANITTLIQAACNGHVRTVEFLLENGAQVNRTDYEGYSALSYAFYNTYRVGSKDRVDLNLRCIEILLQHGADAEWMNRKGDTTLFDLVLESRKFILIKPVLAALVLIESLGSELEDFILIKINSHRFFRSYFDSCKRKIEEMTNSMIIRSVSIFDILTESKQQMSEFARNNGLVRKLESIAYSNRRSKLFYHKILRKRVAELHEIINVREKALNVLSKIQELRNNRVVLEEIVDYLSYKNLQNLAKV